MSQVVYASKDGGGRKVFGALEWLVPPLAGFVHPRQRGADGSVLRLL